MGLESLLTRLESAVTAVTAVTPSCGKACAVTPTTLRDVTAVTVAGSAWGVTAVSSGVVTAVTARNGPAVTLEPAETKAVTPVTSVTSQKDTQQVKPATASEAPARAWLVYYSNGTIEDVHCYPAATRAEILDGRHDVLEAVPDHTYGQPKPETAQTIPTMATIVETGTAWIPDQPPDHPHHPDRAYFDGHAQRLHAYGKRNDELMAAYVQHWHLAADAEPVAHRKANKGRYAANTWLRNLTRWPSQ